MWIPSSEMDITSGRCPITLDDDYIPVKMTWKNAPMMVVRALF